MRTRLLVGGGVAGAPSVLETASSLEGLDTSNGPDLRVYLSAAPKGNKGDQHYDIPAGLDLGRYGRAVIWCKRFSVPFGVAALARA